MMIAVAIECAACSSGPGHATLTLRTAAPASDFVDSIGVNTHLDRPGTTYVDFPRVATALESLGVHHIRDSLSPGAPPAFYTHVQQLAHHGIRTDLVLGSAGRVAGQPLFPAPASLALVSSHQLWPSLDAVEGPNEWDLRGGSGWAAADDAFQRTMYGAVHASGALAGPVVAPSVGSRSNLGSLSVATTAGAANAHAYSKGAAPEATIDAAVAAGHRQLPGKPVFITETGFQNAIAGHGPQPAVSPAVASVYVLRDLAEAFRVGAARTYLYELLDERADASDSDQEAHFGLVTSDFTPKPAFVALQRLLALASTPGNAGAGRLPVTVTGPGDVRSVLLRRADGRYLVLIWRTADVASRTGNPLESTAGQLPVTVTLPASDVVRYRPDVASTPVSRATASTTVTFGLGADLNVLVVSPGHSSP